MSRPDLSLQIVKALADVIRDLGEVPNGHLYARVMGNLSLETYTSAIGTLKHAKLVEEHNNLLRWIGPKA